MPDNFWWLFSAYSIIWLALFGYVASIFGRQKNLERDLRQLEDLVNSRKAG